MAFTGNTLCDSFKSGVIEGSFDFSDDTTDVYKLALYTNNASLNASTALYTTDGEVVASGYTAGGNVLTPSIGILNGVSFVSFVDTSWSGAITARGGLIYKESGPAICVLDFGADRTSTTTFQVDFPTASSDSALIRLS